MTPDQVVAHAGLDPRPFQSGTRDPSRKISKVGNARIRAGIYLPAMSAASHCPEVKALYDRLIAKGKPAFVAVVAVMRRLLRIAWVLIQRGETWNPSKFAPRAPKVELAE
jgi:transposase